METVGQHFKKYNVPRELIGNEDRWEYINEQSKERPAVAPRRGRKRTTPLVKRTRPTVLMEAYFEPKHPGNFCSVQTFKRHLDGKYKTKNIRTWLQNKDAYTLHKPVRLNFRRRMTFTIGIDNLWQAD